MKDWRLEGLLAENPGRLGTDWRLGILWEIGLQAGSPRRRDWSWESWESLEEERLEAESLGVDFSWDVSAAFGGVRFLCLTFLQAFFVFTSLCLRRTTLFSYVVSHAALETLLLLFGSLSRAFSTILDPRGRSEAPRRRPKLVPKRSQDDPR